MRVVLDANALMQPVELGVRTFDELDRLLGDYEPVVPAAVLAELEAMAGGHGDEAVAAQVGADLARRECEILEHAAETADDAVLELASDGGYAVTNDGPLIERLWASNVPVIRLRGRNKLELTEP